MPEIDHRKAKPNASYDETAVTAELEKVQAIFEPRFAAAYSDINLQRAKAFFDAGRMFERRYAEALKNKS